MKLTAFIVLFVFSSFSLKAQHLKPWKIQLVPGATLLISNSNSISISQQMMGQDLQMNTSSELFDSFFVKSKTEDGFIVGKITRRLKMNTDIMGQEKKMDSDNKEDMEGEAGASIKERIGVLVDAFVNKNGNVKILTEVKTQSNIPMLPAMSFNSDSAIIAGYFLKSPAKKIMPGETWNETVADTSLKEETVYRFIKIEKGFAFLSFESAKTITGINEMKGFEVKTNMLTTSKGTLKVDLQTGLVIERITESQISGSNEAMGMQIPLTGTSKSTVIITTN